ncbi:MAG: DUF3995 domain-containing protein [Sulfuricurvum sp.]|jgi:hypothetical protein|uniref:DUF3995 domain-containing protein n=1 Tax=Sulfuricurvum sp. TaxID=2025608 RepID=UPI0025F7C44D|nr:DUF3995 domain-containing protein [Sulfuricurvum sp.]MCK9372808.1 DUF3995 domain-containing protein [Sulfuricurvum sp.]
MSVITILTIVALSLIGLLHFYWALGGVIGLDIAVPTEDDTPLLNPGKVATVIVGIALFGFAFVAYMLYFYDFSSSHYRDYFILSGWIVSGIFTLRGIGEFNAVGLFKKIKSSEFAYYDTRVYTPFALSMGLVFATLAYGAS